MLKMNPPMVLAGLCLVAVAMAAPAISQQLDVPVMERADADLDTCALGEVRGLKADGDGFLAVRTGPATSYSKIDELVNGDRVWLFDQNGPWVGIVYATEDVNCSPISKDRLVPHAGKKGWVHGKWVQIIAG